MLYNEYDLGDTIRLDVSIKVSGAYFDPTYLTLEVVDPDEISSLYVHGTTGTFIKESVGKYYLDYFAGKTGQYKYRYFASGTASGAEVKRFVVRRD